MYSVHVIFMPMRSVLAFNIIHDFVLIIVTEGGQRIFIARAQSFDAMVYGTPG